MNFILSDGTSREAMLPFTYTRPIADIRIGILTIREKWEHFLKCTTSTLAVDYLLSKYPLITDDNNVVINATFLPNAQLAEQVKGLRVGAAIVRSDIVIAYATDDVAREFNLSDYKAISYEEDLITVMNPWDIFSKNGEALEADFKLLTEGRESQPISSTNTVMSPENVFLEEGAVVECSILNANSGYIYIGKNAEIMEGSIIKGSLALCEHAVLKIGSKIYGPSTFGPYCKVGGEVNNSVLFAYSNKGHEGFLGNSVLGEWCNLGADTNTSNLKNNYAHVRLWSYKTEGFAKTELQFCGLIMGDHSKAGINTMFNTGTVVGVNANIFGAGYPRNFIPSYSWGGASGFTTYKPEKSYEAATAMMGRRGIQFDETEKNILDHVFEITAKWRKG